MEVHEISQDSGLFEDLNAWVTSMTGICVSTSYYVDGSVDLNPGDYLTLEGRHLNVRVRMPVYGPIHAAIEGKLPDIICLSVLDGIDAEREYAVKTGGFKNVQTSIFQSFFVNYYEKLIPTIRERYGNADTGWTNAWQMAWLVRNAVAHDGCVYFKSPNHACVEWQGASLDPSNNGESIWDYFSVADLIVLMLEMEADLT